MKRIVGILLIGLVLLGAPHDGLAQPGSVTFESITFSTTSIGFTATTIRPTGKPPMTHCVGKLETDAIRIRWDGTAPTSTVGVPVATGEAVTIDGLANLAAFRGIRSGSSDGVIQFQCSRL